MKNMLSILLWSAIAAAFIGPGTVATAAAAGAGFHFSLLWALLISTIGCLLLQEASARVTIFSGMPLGAAIRQKFSSATTQLLILLLIAGAIILGCAAYEAGNILGGAAGAMMAGDWSRQTITLLIGLIAGLLLWVGSIKMIARMLGILVAVMGVLFFYTAILLKPSLSEMLNGLLRPSLPEGSSLLVMGLIGTTIVPYNLFLGSGLAEGQSIRDTRIGLAVAIIFGGLISMAIVVVGTAVSGPFDYQALADSLSANVGEWAVVLFAWGLFAAGFSSAMTAPLAAALTARSLFANEDTAEDWEEKTWRFRAVWLAVLATGLLFGLLDIKPIPVIILAQALNGILLPLVAVFLLLIVNDRSLMGEEGANNQMTNIAMLLVVMITLVLGMSGILRAAAAAWGLTAPSAAVIMGVAGIFSLPVLFYLLRNVLIAESHNTEM